MLKRLLLPLGCGCCRVRLAAVVLLRSAHEFVPEDMLADNPRRMQQQHMPVLGAGEGVPNFVMMPTVSQSYCLYLVRCVLNKRTHVECSSFMMFPASAVYSS